MDDLDGGPSASPLTAWSGEIHEHPVPTPRGRGLATAFGRCALALISVVTLAMTATGWLMIDRMDRALTSSDVLVDTPDAPAADDGATDILLVGNDSRTDAQGNPLPLSVLKTLRTESTTGLNTDTLILVRVPRNGGEPTAVSVPRDTYTAVAGSRPEKINAVYGLTRSAAARALREQGVTDTRRIAREASVAGQRGLVWSVQQLTGIRVDHYAEVNLLGFYEVTEAVGGVRVCLNRSVSDKDSGADFPAGMQTISGGDALAFVRQRHGLPRGDLDRIVRQQVFMAAVANKVLSTGTLTDPEKLRGLTHAARRSVVLDQEWDIVGFAQQMQGLAAGSVHFMTLPVTDVGARDDRGQSIVTVDPARVKAFVAGLSSGPPTPGAKSGGLRAPGVLRLDGSAYRQQTDSSEVQDPSGTRSTESAESSESAEPTSEAPHVPQVPPTGPAISSGGIPCVN